jgi:hypothetical protein
MPLNENGVIIQIISSTSDKLTNLLSVSVH